MAEVLETLPEWARTRGRKELYPYEQWLNGQRWLLTKGTDYLSDTKACMATIRRAANSRGLKVSLSTNTQGGSNKIVVYTVNKK